MNAQRKRWQN